MLSQAYPFGSAMRAATPPLLRAAGAMNGPLDRWIERSARLALGAAFSSAAASRLGGQPAPLARALRGHDDLRPS